MICMKLNEWKENYKKILKINSTVFLSSLSNFFVFLLLSCNKSHQKIEKPQ